MLQGTVKKIVADRGFGLISGNPQDVFFHFSVVEGDGFSELRKGQRVEYELDDEEDEVSSPARQKPKKRKQARAGYVKPL
jgi:cold shock CspA family protein